MLDEPQPVTEAFVRELERARLRSLVEADMPTARALHAADYQLVPPGGERLSADEYLGGIETGALDYDVFEPASDIEVLLLEDGAAVRYLARIEIRADGQAYVDLVWHTDLYARRDGRWQAVWSQATRTRP